MKVFKPFLAVEPAAWAVDIIEQAAQDSFLIHKGKKIAELQRTAPYFAVIVEMESDGKVIADWSERIAIVVEGSSAVNLHRHVYKLVGYKTTELDMYKKLRDHMKRACPSVDGYVFYVMLSTAGIAAICAD